MSVLAQCETRTLWVLDFAPGSCAASWRRSIAIETQVVPAKSVRYESSPSICTSPMLHTAHVQPCYLHTRLQCDLSGPAKLDARMISTTFRTTDSSYTDATPRVHDLSTLFLCVSNTEDASTDTSTLHSRTQADDEPDRGVLVLKQIVEDGEERFRIMREGWPFGGVASR